MTTGATSGFQIDTVIVGAGVIGVAIARELALDGREVLILDREKRPGQHQSSRNSGVIHAGFYYPDDSLKAKLCHKGKLELYRFAEERRVPHRRVGKIVVATDEAQTGKLEIMHARALACGIDDVQLLSALELRRMEPELAGVAGLWSPSTGVIDASALLDAMEAEATALGAAFSMNSRLLRAEARPDGWTLFVENCGETIRLDCRLLINSAGIEAPHLASCIDGYAAERIPETYLARGNFFSCQGGAPFSHLIYPLPGPIGLGVHLTLDLDGQAKFGPDVELVDQISYDVKPDRAEGFYDAIRAFWPGLKPNTLMPAYSGIRAKIGTPGDPQDWIVETTATHGLFGLVNLFGIETPGMTCSLALARHVAEHLRAEDLL
ncbi:NAD(P)/FAD-dependent oxidoreductase [Rhizobium sp. BK602]|uniref:NAD(P)/FAD-dependent oxidoreductase n=1 Tax=Rhizobium sp. BK602 TaxID=2586986 RepID=UPI00160703A9|nr:NAD(P)/FAD-dependent oxidoreductase [Rhizobium sp. BK602]MBB3610462.1 L-2-hydroxyglutarate oxidase LhgO [Rhizobium sp. BK602]